MADDAQARSGGLGRPAVVAIACAIVALLTSVGAVLVVMRRSAEPAAALPARVTIDHAPLASDVTKLKRDVVEKVPGGVRIADAALATSLGLRPDDVITAINGRAIDREFDVYDAVLGTSMMDVSIMYVEIVREKAPVLVRWKLDGELRTARRDPVRVAPNPYAAPSDPLLATITKLDDTHYEIPRSTYERILANPGDFASHGRIVPMPQGQGYKLYAIRPGSLFATLGLANGDAIRSINGANPDQISEHKDATRLEIVVVRRNLIEHTLVITIK